MGIYNWISNYFVNQLNLECVNLIMDEFVIFNSNIVIFKSVLLVLSYLESRSHDCEGNLINRSVCVKTSLYKISNP